MPAPKYAMMNFEDTVTLLQRLVATPSPSRQENATADIIFSWLQEQGAEPERIFNNVIARAPGFDTSRPTLLLNSHHDTVPPAAGYTRNPYDAAREANRIYGLGSNDAGASAVALIATFLNLRNHPLPFNMILAISAEEECMGEKGMRGLIPQLPHIDMALVGEPTGMNAAIGERGLIVLDCLAHGVSGHAARSEGVNALYIAMEDIATLRNFKFPKESSILGPAKITVTQIEAGTRHNVIPDECKFVVDVRTTDAYTNEETEALLAEAIKADVKARSYRVRPSALADNHPLMKAALACGRSTFLSPTTSDMALMPFPSLKMGPGESSRSHGPDEYIELAEIHQALDIYQRFITTLNP